MSDLRGVIERLSITGGGAGGAAISAGGASQNTGTIIFSNSNGVSFGLNAGTLTASVAPSAANLALSAGTNSTNASTVNFSNANGITFGMDTNAVITGTVATNYQSQGAYLTTAALSQDSSKYAGTNGAITGGSLTLNTSGVSVNISPQTNQTLSLVATGNTTHNSTFTVDARSLTINALGGMTVGFTNGSIEFSGASPTGGGGVAISGDLNSQSTGTVNFSNSNGVSFGLSNNGVMTATVATNYQSQGAYLTTADLSQNSSKYFQDWKLTGNTAGTTSSAQGTDFWLSGGQGITLSGSSNSIVLSVGSYITTADLSQNSSKYVQNWKLTGNTSGTTSSANGTDLWFSGGNSITVSGNGKSIVFSVGNYITTADLSQNSSKYAGINGAITGGSITVNTSGVSVNISTQTNQSVGLYALGNTTQNSSTTLDARTLSFNGLGAQTVGYSNGSIQLSVPSVSTLIGTSGISISTNGGSIFIFTV